MSSKIQTPTNPFPDMETLVPEQLPAALSSLTLAFAADPNFRYMYQDPHSYLKHFPRFVEAFGGGAVTNKTGFALPDMSAVALWFAPGEHAEDEPILEIFLETVPQDMQEEGMEVFERIGTAHAAQPEKHWYLAVLGVESGKQGLGLGSVLMKQCLRLVDDDNMPAYLESSNPQNIPFYERHGFEIVETIEVGNNPPITPMARPPRG